MMELINLIKDGLVNENTLNYIFIVLRNNGFMRVTNS